MISMDQKDSSVKKNTCINLVLLVAKMSMNKVKYGTTRNPVVVVFFLNRNGRKGKSFQLINTPLYSRMVFFILLLLYLYFKI